MRQENDHVHYRAQFIIQPKGARESAFPHIVSILQQWLIRKESSRIQKGESDRIRRRIISSTKETYPNHPAGEDGCPISEWLLTGFETTKDYKGGASRTRGSKLYSKSYAGAGTTRTPQYWAFDYDEPSLDPDTPQRHWHTSVGITLIPKAGESVITPTSPCVVNVRISNYMRKGFVGVEYEQPPANTPNFIPKLLDLDGYEALVGSTLALDEPTYLESPEQFTEDFEKNLLDPSRGLPLLLVCTDRNGKTPMADVDEFAYTLRGVANVYVLDYRSSELRAELFRTFRKSTPSYEYRCGCGMTRIYFPNVDLENAYDSSRHRFFTQKAVEEYGDEFVNIIARSLVGNLPIGSHFVVSTGDIDSVRAHEDTERLRDRVAELKSQRLQHEKAVSEQAETVPKKVYEAAVHDSEEYEALAQEFSDEYDRIKEENEQLASDADRLESLQHEYESQIANLHYQLDRRNASQAATPQLQENDSLYEFNKRPHSLEDTLELFSQCCPDKLVVLPEAIRSAKDYGTVDPDDEWELLWSIPYVLWELEFNTSDTSSLAENYRSATGYELALTETKQTKNDAEMMTLRKRKYRGEEIDITPHIKGKGRSHLRVHFYFDRERRLIVIGHCGEHLTTAGTSRL